MKRRLDSLDLFDPRQAAKLRLPPDAYHLSVEETNPVAAPRALRARTRHMNFGQGPNRKAATQPPLR